MHDFIERVELAISDLKNGKAIILTDNPDRENEGDLIFPAETITSEMMNFIIRHSSGIVCLSILESQMKKLNLEFMIPSDQNSSLRGTPFTVSIDAADGITTGVSAADRVKTVLTAIHPDVKPSDLLKPGHIFPLCAQEGGVLKRQGHTEGSIDIVHLAGFQPAAVLCEIMNEDGTMTRGKELVDFAEKHKLTLLSIDDLIEYRLYHENFISEEVSTEVFLEKYGSFTLTAIKDKISNQEHVVLENKTHNSGDTLVRVHSSCLTGDVFGSARCDCKEQLHYALQKISTDGGVLIYLQQEGRGIGLFNKIKAYALQDNGLDTIEANESLGFPMDSRSYAIAANVLRNRKINNVRLLTNNPQKIHDLKKYGIGHVTKEILPNFCNAYNQKYLTTKKNKLQHMIQDLND